MEEGLRESLAQFEHAYQLGVSPASSIMINDVWSRIRWRSRLGVEEVTSQHGRSLGARHRLSGRQATHSVTRNIGKAISLSCVKCEGCVDSEASQVIGSPLPPSCRISASSS